MKVLVTGGAGFIGSHIVELLIENGITPIVIDNFSTGRKEWVPRHITLYQIDVHSKLLNTVFEKEKPDYVIHLAAQVNMAKSKINPVFDAKNNILGTVRVLKCCHDFGVKKMIYASSCAVYGDSEDHCLVETFPVNPKSFYGISKYTPELYIKAFKETYGLPYTILRYANVYGPRQIPKGEGGVVSIFMQKLLKNESPTIFGDGKQTRDFIYVKDVAQANVQALFKGTNEIFNIGTDEETSINELYKQIADMIPTTISPKYVSSRKGDILFSQLNNSKAKTFLDWSPGYDLAEGLKETMSFYRKVGYKRN